MKKILIVLAFLPLGLSSLFAGEGMWLPLLLQSLNEAEMQSLGMKMTAEDIYSVNKGSLKDAIVHFGGFCTAEVISGSGLLLTNHHCGYSQIQSHSSVGNNLLKDGFWADGHQEELPNPGLFAKFIQNIEDVSEAALKGVTDNMASAARQKIIDANLKTIKEKYTLKEFEEISIRPFFKGNQYFLFKTITFPDVRLVGTPPESIGKFGSDTDNWVWPRHTGDFSLFRIYAGPNNEPAEYSTENKPYTPKHFLPISLDGVTEDDFTLIFGFPGRTNEYLPSYAVEQIVEKRNPARIAIRDRALKIIDKYMREDEETRIQYASKFARVANYWKKWIGESQGLKSTGAIEKKKTYEKEFASRMNRDMTMKSKYGNILDQFKRKYDSIGDLVFTSDYFSEYTRNVELVRIVNFMRRLEKSHLSGDQEGYDNFKKRLEGFFTGFYKNYKANIDEEVFAALTEMYFTNVDAKYISPEARQMLQKYNGDYAAFAASTHGASNFTTAASINKLLAKPAQEAVQAMSADPLFRYISALTQHHNETVGTPNKKIQTEIDDLMRKYMKAQMEVFKEKKFYPDANSTMRVTYGQVKGYEPRDAVSYTAQTFLGGVIEKYQPGDYEFDVHPKLVELYEQKDYGKYHQDGKMPVCFIGTNHTTGGNSGSPVIDAYGNLVGLNFDRVWEGTMSDINYDPSICRNIMVDTRFILFVIDKFGGASHLIEELKLVYPKTSPENFAVPRPARGPKATEKNSKSNSKKNSKYNLKSRSTKRIVDPNAAKQ